MLRLMPCNMRDLGDRGLPSFPPKCDPDERDDCAITRNGPLAIVGFPASPGELVNVRDVRRRIRELLGDGHPKLDDIELLVSEVSTNAVRHTATGKPGGSLEMTVFAYGGRVRVELTDDGGTAGPAEPTGPIGERGRGLLIVRSLADDCGARQDEAGRTTVWFEVIGP